MAASDLPLASKAAQWLGGEIPNISAKFGGSSFLPAVTRQSIGGGIYGGITNPQNPEEGALKGAEIAAPLSAIPFAPPVMRSLSDYFNPQKVSDQILNTIGGGNDVAENAKSLATDVQNSYKTQAAPLKQGFNDIKDQVGSDSIYQSTPTRQAQPGNFNNVNSVIDYVNDLHNTNLEDPDELHDFLNDKYGVDFKNNSQLMKFFNSSPSSALKQATPTVSGAQLAPSYLQTYPKIENYVTPDIKDLHETFTQNPTYDNARQLFSQYASEVARLQGKGPTNLDSAENAQLQSLSKGKAAIDSDIQSFLTSKNPSLTDQYNQLKQGWVKNVIPYHASDVNQLLGNNPDVPVNIHTLFGTAKHLPDVNDLKVFSDLPENSQNKIIYSALGKQTATKTPEALNNQFNKLGEQGLGDFVSPSLKDQFDQLQGMMGRRTALNTVTGGGLGYLLGHHLGFSPETTGLVGGYIGNKILPKVYNNPLVQSLSRGVSAGAGAYSPLSTALRASLIPGGQ